ncbi:MAG: TOBE domain-containing protein, partial [Burkholderiales bacterium]
MQVELTELLGAERLIHGRLADSPFIVRTDARLAAPSAGQIVGLEISPESLHWFDPTSQKRIPA